MLKFVSNCVTWHALYKVQKLVKLNSTTFTSCFS